MNRVIINIYGAYSGTINILWNILGFEILLVQALGVRTFTLDQATLRGYQSTNIVNNLTIK